MLSLNMALCIWIIAVVEIIALKVQFGTNDIIII